MFYMYKPAFRRHEKAYDLVQSKNLNFYCYIFTYMINQSNTCMSYNHALKSEYAPYKLAFKRAIGQNASASNSRSAV